MANEIPQITLKQATLNQSSFNPFIYTPVQRDANILRDSIKTNIESQDLANQKRAEFLTSLAGTKSAINEQEWAAFDALANPLLQEVEDAYASGNYQMAKNLVVTNASKLAAFTAKKTKDQQLYLENEKDLKDRFDKKRIKGTTYEWAKSVNAYNSPEGGVYTPNVIYDDIDWMQEYANAFSMIKPNEISSTNSGTETFYDDKGNQVNPIKGYAYSATTSGGGSKSEITIEDIKNNLRYMLSDPERLNQIKQEYKVYLFQIDKLQKELDNLLDNSETIPDSNEQIQAIEKTLDEYKKIAYNGYGPDRESDIDYNAFFERKISNDIVNNLAYIRKTSSGGINYGVNPNYTPGGQVPDSYSRDENGNIVKATPAVSTEQKFGFSESAKNVTGVQNFVDNAFASQYVNTTDSIQKPPFISYLNN